MPSEEMAALYRRCGALVVRRCRMILGDQQEAEDVLQEVFIRLMRWGDFEREADVPLAWLYRTAERCCFDRMRKRGREMPGLAPELFLELAVPSEQSKHEAAEIVFKFFDKLDDKLKQVALLHYVDGLPQERIAQALNWSRRTVGKKLKGLRRRAERLARDMERR